MASDGHSEHLREIDGKLQNITSGDVSVFWESRQNRDRQDRQCSFCGKRENVVKSLIESPATYHCHACQSGSNLLICNECVQLCSTFLAEGGASAKPVISSSIHLPKPTDIKATLDEYVVGQ